MSQTEDITHNEYEEPTTLDDISNNLSSIENDMLLLNEKVERLNTRGIKALLFLILLVLIYIAFT